MNLSLFTKVIELITITNLNEAKSRIRQILHRLDHSALTYMDRLIDAIAF